MLLPSAGRGPTSSDGAKELLTSRLLRGAPPLGPGAPPVERLTAFYRAMVELLERFGNLLLSAEGC